MSTQPSQSFHFDGYTVRPITEQDRPYLQLQIDADDYHRHKMDADFFLKLKPGESAWALEDEQGLIVFYFKNVPVVRMHIQFAVDDRLEAKRRNIDALSRGLAWIMGIFRVARFREIITDPDGPELSLFLRRRLGFVDAPRLLWTAVSLGSEPKMEPEPLGTVPTDRLERAG